MNAEDSPTVPEPSSKLAKYPLTPPMRAYLRRAASWKQTKKELGAYVAAVLLFGFLGITWWPSLAGAISGALVGLVLVVASCTWVSLSAREAQQDGTYEEFSGPIWLEQEEVSDSDVLLYKVATPSHGFPISEADFRMLCKRLGAQREKARRPFNHVLQEKWVTRYGAWGKVTYLPTVAGRLLEVRDASGQQLYFDPLFGPDVDGRRSVP